MSSLLLAIVACSGSQPDAQLDPLKAALDAYDAGRASLDAGDPRAAVASLGLAVEHDPRSPELWLWLGKAHADAGDDLDAIQAADRALGLAPDLLEARYDRACWRARFGDLDGAAEDLALAIQDARLDPFQVAVDPDLEPLRASPGHAHVVPRPVLPVQLTVETEPAFLGGEVVVGVDVLHPPAHPLSFDAPAPGPVSVRRVIEDRTVQGPVQATGLRIAYVVHGAGELVAGPWTVRAGPFAGTSPSGSVPLLAPEGHTGTLPETPWLLPSEALAHPGRTGPRVVVVGEPGDTVRWDATDVVALELRDGGQPVQIGWSGVLPAGQPVTLVRGRRDVWTETP